MQPGDVLVAFTDGITESPSRSGEEDGEARLCRVVLEQRDASVEELKDGILREVREFAKGAEQHDDLTIVTLKARTS